MKIGMFSFDRLLNFVFITESLFCVLRLILHCKPKIVILIGNAKEDWLYHQCTIPPRNLIDTGFSRKN